MALPNAAEDTGQVVAADLLEHIPAAPAMTEANNASSSAKQISISTWVYGRATRMSRVAWMPLPSNRASNSAASCYRRRRPGLSWTFSTEAPRRLALTSNTTRTSAHTMMLVVTTAATVPWLAWVAAARPGRRIHRRAARFTVRPPR
jgi:hypothetical protein